MFRKKKKEESNLVSEAVHNDLIIHNMPSPTRFGGPAAADSFSTSFQSSSSTQKIEPKNFQIAGLTIMASGLVFIGLIFYFGYQYMIKPMVSPVVSVTNVSPNNQEKTDLVESEIIEDDSVSPASTTDLTVNPVTEVESIISEPETTITTVDETPAVIITPAPDSDGDGLSDPEEAVFGTNPLLSDTDDDGYTDEIEISGEYNPLGEGRLIGAFEQYKNTVFGYEVSYPTGWPKQILGESSAVILSAPDDSLIQIVAQENINRLSIMSWYTENFPNAEVSYDMIKSGNAWEGIMGTDGLNFYLTDEAHGRILIVSYISSNNQKSYPFIWDRIIESLLLR